MANNASYVSAGKPNKGGAVFKAPAGTTIPADAVSTLDSQTFVSLGYCSEDGVTNSNSPSVTIVRAWGRDPVLTTQDDKTDTFQFTMIEALNENVLAAVYGEDNITGSLATGLTVTANSDEPDELVWVIDMVLKGDVKKRVVIPKGQVTEVADIVYNDTDAIGYQVTITGLADASGNTHYEYFKSA